MTDRQLKMSVFMYRRNISNILYPIAGVLGLIIVYEAVLKPVYIQTPPPIDHNAPIDRTDRVPDQAMNRPLRNLWHWLKSNCASLMRVGYPTPTP